MKKTKSRSAYTNIWLNKNKQHWYETDFKNRKGFALKGDKQIVITKKDAPKIVLDGVDYINKCRFNKAVKKYKETSIRNERTHGELYKEFLVNPQYKVKKFIINGKQKNIR